MDPIWRWSEDAIDDYIETRHCDQDVRDMCAHIKALEKEVRKLTHLIVCYKKLATKAIMDLAESLEDDLCKSLDLF